MKYKLYAVNNCHLCNSVVEVLDKKGIKYEKIICGPAEIDFLSDKTDRMMLPVLLDENNKDVYYEDWLNEK